MKIQIEGQQWRLRIDESELQRLLGDETLMAVSEGAGRFTLRVSVRLASQEIAALDGDASHWSFSLPVSQVRELSERIPTRDGLNFVVTGDNEAQSLGLRFDVDVRDSARRLKASRRGDA